MTRESLVTQDWEGVVARLGGATTLEQSARDTKAFLRARIKSRSNSASPPSPTFSTGEASGWKGPWNQGWGVEGLHYMAGCGC